MFAWLFGLAVGWILRGLWDQRREGVDEAAAEPPPMPPAAAFAHGRDAAPAAE